MEKQSATSVDEIEARAQAGTHATARRAVLLLDMENFYHSRKDVARETNPGKGYHLEDLNGDLKVLKDWVGLTLGGTRLTIARGYADYRALSKSVSSVPTSLMTLGIEPVQVYALAGQKNAVDLRIAMDAAYAVRSPLAPAECIILVAGDSDYVPVVLQLRTLGADALVVGCDNSSSRKKTTGTYLRHFASRFWYFDEMEKEYKDSVKKEVEREQQDKVQPSSKYYEMILGGEKPRFKLVPKEDWNTLTKKIYDHMLDSQAETPKFWADFIRADLGVENGCERAVIGQLLYSECFEFEPLQSGTASSNGADEWERPVRLAPGIKSPESMWIHTQREIVRVLKQRLKSLGDSRPLRAEVIAEMFFGPNPSPSDVKAAEKLVKGQK